MSSPEGRRAVLRRILAGAVLATGLASFAGCTVQPLYGGGPAAGGSMVSRLSSVDVAEVDTRQALEVRNQLIYLLSGGTGRPVNPSHVVDLGISSRTTNAATVQIATDNEPSAGTVTMTSDYVLRALATDEIVASGRRMAAASFDRTRQQFGNLRAERDAENRAARELAEMLRLALAQDLSRLEKR